METLDLDAPAGGFAWTVAELAEHLDRSPRQIRTAVRSLEDRELVRTQRVAIDWIEAERGFPARLLERPVHGLIVAEASKADAEDERIRKLLRAAGAL